MLSDVASDAGHVLASTWVAQRYIEMVTKVRYRQLRKIGEVVVPATILAGTVTVVEGSDIVTPDATALAAWSAIPNDGLVGRYLRFQDAEWYQVMQFVGGVVTLASPYAVAGAAGIGYNLAARYITLADDARWLGDFMHMRLWKPLEIVPLETLDYIAPGRPYAQGVPSVMSEIGLSADGRRVVEIYPYPSQSEIINYVYWALPLTLTFESEIPRMIPAYTLKEGALINAMRYKMSQALTLGKVDEAAVWRNEFRAQETKWYNKILPDAARADRGVDDVTMIVQGFGSRYGRPWIRTAHDQVYNSWW